MEILEEKPKYTLIVASHQVGYKLEENQQLEYIIELVNYYLERYPILKEYLSIIFMPYRQSHEIKSLIQAADISN